MGRIFSTSFESVADFQGSYITPPTATASHGQSAEQVRAGKYSHKGWIIAAAPVVPGQNTNHRGYPTVQLHKLPDGGFRTPCLVDFWAWLDMTFEPGEWFSLATLARRSSDEFWDGVLLNVSDQGIVHLYHVPTVGKGERTFQDVTAAARFPMRQWVHIQMLVDFDPVNGRAAAYMDGRLVSSALVQDGHGVLEQAHFGLYAPPTMSAGVVYNESLMIVEEFRL